MSEKQELLTKLRIARETKNLSYQNIVDITEANGEAVSLSTVKRIFQKDSDLEDFRYQQTIRPVIRAVLGLDEETEAPEPTPSVEQAEKYYATIEGLKAVLDLKHEQITDLRAQLAKTEQEHQKKVDYLKGIINDYRAATKWYKRLIVIFGIIAALFIIALIADLLLGNFGWIRY